MKVHDQADWQLQCASFAADPSPLAPKFKAFIETWAENAEGLLAAIRDHPEYIAAQQDENADAMEALRNTLTRTEEKAGPFSIGFIGQALLLLCTHWEPITDRDEFFGSLTAIEQHLFNDAVAVWQIHQALQAQEVGNDQ
jgi:hypothetical protein